MTGSGAVLSLGPVVKKGPDLSISGRRYVPLGVAYTQQPAGHLLQPPILDLGTLLWYSVHAAAPPRPAAAHQQPPANGNDVGGDPQNLVRGRVCGHLQNFTTSPMAHSWCWAKFLVLATELRCCGWSLSDPGRRRQQGCSVTVGFRPFVQGRHPRQRRQPMGPGGHCSSSQGVGTNPCCTDWVCVDGARGQAIGPK